MKSALIVFALVFFAGGTLRSELKVGDPAPPLKVSKWVKGKPVNLADGKDKNIYVVEFWATWCRPCVQTIPHLSKLAGHFEKKGVTVIGVSVDDEKTLERVEPFVKEMDKKMAYTVALDDGDATNKAYMEAAGVDGIPHAFLIGKDGKLAWHGHPLDGLDIKLAELVGDRAFAESAKKIKELRESLQRSLRGEKWDEAMTAADKLIELEPDEQGLLALKYKLLAVKKKDPAAAARWGKDVVKKSGDADFLNEISWGILTEDDYEGARDLPLALAAAKKANELSGGKSWSIIDTYARALFDTGDKKQALELERKALALAQKENVPEDQIKDMTEALERYEKAQGQDGKSPEKEKGKEKEKE